MISVAASVKRLAQPSSLTGRGIGPAISLIDRPCSLCRFGFERQTRVRLRAGDDQVCGELANDGTVLEAVARTAAHNPDVVVVRMAVDQQIPVGSILVLADAGADHRRALHRRKAALDPGARTSNGF